MKILSAFIFSLFFTAFCTKAEPCSLKDSSNTTVLPVIGVHYLGHASFLLQFDNGISVLTDYGASNSYGLDSPVYDLKGLEPDVVIFSHSHPDHKRPDAAFGKSSRVITAPESISIKGLTITPIPTSEKSLNTLDNTGYLFTYKGLNVLHIADAQALIMADSSESIKQMIKKVYTKKYDLLFMTIQGVNEFIPQAEVFVNLIEPARIIPMHYWSRKYKADFLSYLENMNRTAGRNYRIISTSKADYELYTNDKTDSLQVIDLEPAG
ncbi:MAG TPA: MBL fold metallo-hydrolase [Ignavibacteriales bacterium]|nr:MBL fold metallo-hydrolase [Ignavibacteriales bacterium]